MPARLGDLTVDELAQTYGLSGSDVLAIQKGLVRSRNSSQKSPFAGLGLARKKAAKKAARKR
jgi:hypothetical protein